VVGEFDLQMEYDLGKPRPNKELWTFELRQQGSWKCNLISTNLHLSVKPYRKTRTLERKLEL